MAASTSTSPVAFFKEYRVRFISSMMSRFPNVRREEIEDLFQDSFLILVKNCADGNKLPGNKWFGYLVAVGFRQLTKKMRNSKNVIMLSIDCNGEDGPESIISEMETAQRERNEGDLSPLEMEERYMKLENVLSSFPENASGILTDKYILGLSDREIAVKREYANASTVKAKRFQVVRKAQQLCSTGAA